MSERFTRQLAHAVIIPLFFPFFKKLPAGSVQLILQFLNLVGASLVLPPIVFYKTVEFVVFIVCSVVAVGLRGRNPTSRGLVHCLRWNKS